MSHGESSEELSGTTDSAVEDTGDSEGKVGGVGGVVSPPTSLHPAVPTSTVSMVRRIVSGLTLKSEESHMRSDGGGGREGVRGGVREGVRGRGREVVRGGHVGSLVHSTTVDMLSDESPDVCSPKELVSHDSYVTRSHDPGSTPHDGHMTRAAKSDATLPATVAIHDQSPTQGEEHVPGDDQSEHSSVTSSTGTPASAKRSSSGRGRGRGRGRRQATPRSVKPATPTLKSGGT